VFLGLSLLSFGWKLIGISKMDTVLLQYEMDKLTPEQQAILLAWRETPEYKTYMKKIFSLYAWNTN